MHTEADQTSFTFMPAKGEPILLKYAEDYITKDQTGAATADLDAPIVFVGYGIDAPEYHWNDYEGVDVKGKILLIIVNEPPSTDETFFKGKALTYYGRWTYKFEEAARKGALGRPDHPPHRPGKLRFRSSGQLRSDRSLLSAKQSAIDPPRRQLDTNRSR